MHQTRRNSLTMMTAGIVLCSMSIVCLLTQPLWANVTAAQLCTAMVGKSYPVSQGYLGYCTCNPTKDKLHAGIDYAIPKGTLVRSVIGGEVTYAGGPYGSVGVYDAKNDATVFYLHLENIRVRKGARIEFGTPIGYVSNVSPHKIGVHLHMEIRAKWQTSAIGEASGTPTSSLTYNPLKFF